MSFVPRTMKAAPDATLILPAAVGCCASTGVAVANTKAMTQVPRFLITPPVACFGTPCDEFVEASQDCKTGWSRGVRGIQPSIFGHKMPALHRSSQPTSVTSAIRTPQVCGGESPYYTCPVLTPSIPLLERYCGSLIGLAVGDALGTTLESQAPGTFEALGDMVGGGR